MDRMRKFPLPALLLTLSWSCPTTRAAEADVVVYGGTSAGVIAAVQAKKMGKSVVLVSPGVAYHGLDILEPAQRFGRRPMLLVATEGDTASAHALDSISGATDRADRQYYREGTAHGLAIAEESSDLYPRMSMWLLAKLGISPPTR